MRTFRRQRSKVPGNLRRAWPPGPAFAPTGAALSVVLFAQVLPAEPLRLRGDALLEARSPSPVGVVVLQGEDQLRPWISAEAVTWLGAGVAGTDAPSGDVLSLSVRLRDRASGSDLRAGRLLVASGAIRPLHLDGARGVLRTVHGTSLEAFAGVPVVRRFDHKAFAWAAGGRLAQSIQDAVAVGASYVQRRYDGERADEEAGADFTLTPVREVAAAGRYAFDVVGRGTTDAQASVSAQKGDVRGEVFATYRVPGRLLPSTSLFSVLGDFAATSVGATARWRAFPRLELVATGTGQRQDARGGGQALGRATLSFADEGDGSLGVEARRVTFGDVRWTGARLVLAVPLAARFRAALEGELVVPDDAGRAPAVWPWGLGALGFAPAPGWDTAVGVEAARGPLSDSLRALARVSYAVGASAPGRPR